MCCSRKWFSLFCINFSTILTMLDKREIDLQLLQDNLDPLLNTKIKCGYFNKLRKMPFSNSNVNSTIFDLKGNITTTYVFYDAVTENEQSLIFIFRSFFAFLNIRTLVLVYIWIYITINIVTFEIIVATRWRHGKIYGTITRIFIFWNFSVFLNISSVVFFYVWNIISVAVFVIFVTAGWCYGKIFSAIARI